MADSRFFPWFKLEFGQLKAAEGALARAATAVASVVPIDRNYYEADIKVVMRYALTGNTFEITIAGLSGAVYDTIEPDQTTVKISLGYYDGLTNQVLEGVVQKKSAKAGECFYETTLSGVEKSYHQLQTTCLGAEFKFTAGADFKEILGKLAEAVDGVELDDTHNIIPHERTSLSREWSFDKKSALYALGQLQDQIRGIPNYSLLLRDDTIWYGYAEENGKNNAGKVIGEPVYSYDNYLVNSDPVKQTRGGRRRLCPPPKKEKAKKGTAPPAYSFEILGDPQLRPGDTIKAKIDKDGKEEEISLTIESITHDFSRAKGYRCTGRALKAEEFLKHVFQAMAPGAEAVGEEVNNLLARNQDRYPAVNVGDVTNYVAERHLADAKLGLEFEPTVTSPSIQVRQDVEGFNLERRPIVAPFAWNHCGLVVPVYPGMRAVAVHNRYLREDALLSGFLWTEEMSPPPSQNGDYWLCLPLNVPDDRPPNDSDKAANDLTTGDGKRVIQLKGLRITIGQGLLPNLGDRPEQFADEELQIECKNQSGNTSTITMKGNEIKLEAGGRTVDISGGKVKIS
jgi:hypothetical protein